MQRINRGLAVAAAALSTLITAPSVRADASRLTVEIGGLDQSGGLPDRAAFCPPASRLAHDISPPLTWSAGPPETRAYALLMIDPDVPQDFSQINKPGTIIAADAVRIAVHHWVLVDIPPTVTSLAAGVDGDGFVPHGKPVGDTAHGRRGANIYTSFLAANPAIR